MPDILINPTDGSVGTIVRKRKRLIVEIPNALHFQFKTLCANLGVAMSDVMERAVLDYVQHPPKPGVGSPLRSTLMAGDSTLPEIPEETEGITYRQPRADAPPPLKAFPCGPVYRVRKGSPEAQYFHPSTVWADEAKNEFDKDGWVLDKTQPESEWKFTDAANGRGMWLITIAPAVENGWKPKTWFSHYDELMQMLMVSSQEDDIKLLEILARWKNSMSKKVYMED